MNPAGIHKREGIGKPRPEELIVTLPAVMATNVSRIEPDIARRFTPISDPPGPKLGSAGGTAYALTETWHRTANGIPFPNWLAQRSKLIIHGSGESRRLPAYAIAGKPFIPIPFLPTFNRQPIRPFLLDLLIPCYQRILRHAPPLYDVMIACGDVLLKSESYLPPFPAVDVLAIGMEASPEDASHHGVFFSRRNQPGRLAFVLQKPDPDRIRDLATEYLFSLDTGAWLLSQRAVSVLLRKCGWSQRTNRYAGDRPKRYELYSEFGLSLGEQPQQSDPDVQPLSCAVLPLPQARFYHFGTNRSLIASVSALAQPPAERRSFGHAASEVGPSVFVQHAKLDSRLNSDAAAIWIENSHVPAGWKLSREHVLTGIPENNWRLSLPPGACLDFVPMGARDFCLRVYGFDDRFSGAVGAPGTLWLGRPARTWLRVRGIRWTDAGIGPDMDIQKAPLFPVLTGGSANPRFIEWMISPAPPNDPAHRATWLKALRLSALDLAQRANLDRMWSQREAHTAQTLRTAARRSWADMSDHLDLAASARDLFRRGIRPTVPADSTPPTLRLMHDRVFRSCLLPASRRRLQSESLAILRHIIVRHVESVPVQPRRNLLDDQIVWGRSPVRLDIAGGWTDTPPYCLEYGGRVVNIAVDLNGQPAIQVFARLCERPEIAVRSIDLGLDERITTYETLGQYRELGSGFGIARAALALAGFEPRFHAAPRYRNLRAQLLKEFGGGIDISLLAAVPKGSGLGTSSILAASLLGVLNEVCGLGWTLPDIFQRTLALEQMLTSGGGWQDQIGGLVRGLKRIETTAGFAQNAVIRWLPATFFESDYANRLVLLYYTGLTRMAHDILGEIVRNMFLRAESSMGAVEDIGWNADFLTDALQRNDWDGFCEAVRRSWILNQILDRGTNPPPVQRILDRIADHAAAFKLLGAGGGGYLLILAKDEEAGRRIRHTLESRPPNARARFVHLGVSNVGFQVTRS